MAITPPVGPEGTPPVIPEEVPPVSPEGTPPVIPEEVPPVDEIVKLKYSDDTPVETFLSQFPEYKDNKTITRYKSVGDLLKGLTELDSKIGTMVSLPGENASEEEKTAAFDKIFQKLGKPVSSDSYDLSENVPEGLEFNADLQKTFKEFAHKNNFTTEQAKAAQEFWNNQMGTTMEQHQRNQLIAGETNAETQVTELKTNWGSEYKTRTQIALNTAKQLLSQDTLIYLDETGLGNNAKFIQDFYNISKKFSGDGPPKDPMNFGDEDSFDSLSSESLKIKSEKNWQNDPMKVKRVKELDTRRAELLYEKKK